MGDRRRDYDENEGSIDPEVLYKRSTALVRVHRHIDLFYFAQVAVGKGSVSGARKKEQPHRLGWWVGADVRPCGCCGETVEGRWTGSKKGRSGARVSTCS